MQWNDVGYVLSTRKYGDHKLILDVFTREHGRHAGLVQSARKSAAACQPGNKVRVQWSGRLQGHLGTYQCELDRPCFSHVMSDPVRLLALQSVCDIALTNLLEHEPQPRLYEQFESIIIALIENRTWLYQLVHMEMEWLATLGYGLDLSRCIASGSTEQLVYVSPRSGAAVSQEAGEPYKDKLLALPDFLRQPAESLPSLAEIIDGLRLTGYFLQKYMGHGEGTRPLPISRRRLMEKLLEKEAV